MSRVLFLSHSHAFGPFRVGSHHYARALAQAGADVVHLSTPISLAHRVTGRVDSAAPVPVGAHRDEVGVLHIVPRTTLPAPYGAFRVGRELSRLGIPLGFDAVLLDQPLLWDDTVRQLAPRLVYRPTDAYPSGVKNRLQQRILCAADGVVATSDNVLRGLGALTCPSLVIENGVDAARFTPPVTQPRPATCVYIGALDARFDGSQVDAWARAHPSVRFVIAGPVPTPAPMEPAANVELLGPVAYEDLPALLESARVGLLPLSDDPLNAGRSPMKLYEYLAAGLAVVARETPVITSAEEAGLFTYAGSGDAEAAFRRALDYPTPNQAGMQRAARESWTLKSRQLWSFVEALSGGH